MFPVLSRMLAEDWPPLSVLYLCPLRALLNNLSPRIEHYTTLVGRRTALWHGDVGESAREAIRDEPPDVLLTTPESIEAMFISRKTDHEGIFRHVRAVVVDEIHAFAGDDRGWHLLAVAERIQRIAAHEIQRRRCGASGAASAGPSSAAPARAQRPGGSTRDAARTGSAESGSRSRSRGPAARGWRRQLSDLQADARPFIDRLAELQKQKRGPFAPDRAVLAPGLRAEVTCPLAPRPFLPPPLSAVDRGGQPFQEKREAGHGCDDQQGRHARSLRPAPGRIRGTCPNRVIAATLVIHIGKRGAWPRTRR